MRRSRPYTAMEFGRLFGNAWAGWGAWPDVMAVRRGDRRVNRLRDLVTDRVMTEIHQFDDDQTQAEADFWEGFVVGVNELVEGALDSQDLQQQHDEERSEFLVNDE